MGKARSGRKEAREGGAWSLIVILAMLKHKAKSWARLQHGICQDTIALELPTSPAPPSDAPGCSLSFLTLLAPFIFRRGFFLGGVGGCRSWTTQLAGRAVLDRPGRVSSKAGDGV